ncbi:hypothetical protein M409DRAFT_18988 [Zasmidium cellare ATCC 36951]|uniref:Major facilitator superfamily (MFS) profile domain-containing protein n=1 Tax=Zasmidium cellare ATCC 36951 TaxID=1080233 RepID=A0A6A6D053_ZASCE|nr:uncharacterized protein M409DRAFT_18988 [Zasmidium cellare ATCC 36951]KAF2171016.1 hypothetical protein M409DRAFT_18988 [Zasmidium cellare ATCC 36951]
MADVTRTDGGQMQPLLGRRNHLEGHRETKKEWLRKPAVPWILIPITLVSAALSSTLASKQTLMLDLVCRDLRDHSDSDCNSPKVYTRLAILNLSIALCGSLPLIFSVPYLCAVSDHHSRKRPLLIAIAGITASEMIPLFAATFQKTFPTYLLLLGAGLKGSTGHILVTTSVAESYLRDCTSAAGRTKAFAYLYGCLAAGSAAGSYVAELLEEMVDGMVARFSATFGLAVLALAFLWLLVPESLAAEVIPQDDTPQPTEEPRRLWSSLKSFSDSPRARRNIVSLAIIDTLIFGVGLGSASIIRHAFVKFGWVAVKLNRLTMVSYAATFLADAILLPVLVRILRPDESSQCMNLDLVLIRGALITKAIGYIGIAISPTPILFLVSIALVSFGNIATPVVHSDLTKHVDQRKTARLLGVIGLLQKLMTIPFSVVFEAVFDAGAGSAVPGLVFLLLAALLGVGGVVSLKIVTRNI